MGYITSRREIEANPKKIKALLEVRSARRLKEVQSLVDRIDALTRTVEKAIDIFQSICKSLKKTDGFKHIKECEKSFQETKAYFGSPAFLSKPKESDTL